MEQVILNRQTINNMKTYQELQKEVNELRALKEALTIKLLREQNRNFHLLKIQLTTTKACVDIAKEYNGLADQYDITRSAFPLNRSQDKVNSLIDLTIKTASTIFPEIKNYL